MLWRFISLPINGVDGKEESELTLNRVFLRMGDGIGPCCVVPGAGKVEDDTLVIPEGATPILFTGEDCGLFSGDPVQPRKSWSETWCRE